MKKIQLILLTLSILLAVNVNAQEPVYASGRITATETGLPVSGKEVSIGLDIGLALFTEYTDENGFYIAIIPPAMFDTTQTLIVWVTDCNQEIQFHPFVANPNLFFVLDFEICTLNSGCQASFMYRPEPANPQLIFFENLSFPVTNTTNWTWNFGDGTVSSEQNPVHEFVSSGIYNVCLYMSDSAGACSSVFCLEVWIDTNPLECQAMFTYIPEGLTASFFDQSTGFPDTYYWDFGDGTSSNEPNPVHTWVTTGTYLVCLNISNSNTFCESNFCELVTFVDSVQVCKAMFGWIPEGQTVSFLDYSTGEPDSWLWVFDDGTTSSLPNPVHSWEFPGTYQVCLSIYNSNTMCESTFCDYVMVGDTLPSCEASYTYQELGGNTIAFTNLSTGLIDQVTWDFGDGSPFSHETNPVYTWQQAGIYQVCLAVVSNFSGCQDVLCLDITVGDTVSACQAAFTALVDSVPGNINHYWFIDESTGFNISSWYWDFGDGTISFIQHPDYTFAESGTYNVCLTASGEGNGGYCSSTICQTINTPSYSNLGGQIFAGDFPINNPDFINDVAKVRLYRKSGNSLTEVASGQFYEYGYYFFLDVPEGNYVTHAELMPGSPSFMSYVPGYTGVTESWLASQHFVLDGADFYEAHIHMTEMTLPETGPGSINGNIVGIDNMPLDLNDRIIFLYHNDSVVSYDHTDSFGYFEFNDLPLTTYRLRAEIAGKYSNVVDVNLSGTQIQIQGLQLEVSSSGVFGFEDQPASQESEISLFPNPVDDLINIRVHSETAGECNFRIIAANGAVVAEFKAVLQTGGNLISTYAGNLPSGLYVITCSDVKNYWLRSVRFIKK